MERQWFDKQDWDAFWRFWEEAIQRIPDPDHGEAAATRYERLLYNKNTDLSLLRLRLETGRTHQIRVHMKYIGHPLPGDFLYNPDFRYIRRQALHSVRLSFPHPFTGEVLDFSAPLPEDMARLVGEHHEHKEESSPC